MTTDQSLGQRLPSDAFPKASFDGLAFMYADLRVRGGVRYAVHEFPHSAGGEPEKMGRKPYVISFRAMFNDIPGSDLAREYPDAYPDGLRILREKFEIQLTGSLVVPTIGKIQAFCTDWTQTYDVRNPTGETFDLEFLEDQESSFLVAGVSGGLAGAAAVGEASDALLAAAAIADFKKKDTLGLFQQINDLVVGVQGVIGQADAYSNLVAGKLEGLANLCSFADATVSELQDPQNHVVVTALKDLWFAAKQLAENVAETNQALLVYVVPRAMTIGQISSVLYGSSDKSGDILQLNAVDDAFAVPAGTRIKYVK